jgi:hypothetical protein
VTDFLLYGLNEAGEAAFCELLCDHDRETLRTLAHARLRDWSADEIWEGPVCVVRLRRPKAP